MSTNNQHQDRVMEILNNSVAINDARSIARDNNDNDALTASQLNDVARFKNRGNEEPVVERSTVVNEFVHKREVPQTTDVKKSQKRAILIAGAAVAATVVAQSVLLLTKGKEKN